MTKFMKKSMTYQALWTWRKPLFMLLCMIVLSVPQSVRAAEVPLELPPGFRATLFAADNIAPSVQCMTTDSQGRIVVSGPGYIHTLIDADHDGIAESFEVFANGPASGAQGLCFDGSKLYSVGEDGIMLYVDEDRDGKADGEAELIYRCRTGGEHFAHAIRKGPDGWFYLIQGNETGIDETLIDNASSPIRKPDAGLLLRFSPNFSEIQVLADGYRNAYDFDFNYIGDLFAYDSDGERDISLPWYRPTRVFNTVSGMNHGWVSRSWKRPNYFLEMCPTLVEAGRGSPTGVVSYQHRQFPEEFRNTLFVLDWTYGRVIAVKMKRQGASWVAQSRDFAKGISPYGFAPTDAVVGADGALYVSAGGRGTQGSVFRITYENADGSDQTIVQKVLPPIERVLQADQPLEAWSRARWEPLTKAIGEEAFLRAALDRERSVPERLRAIEVLTEKFQGPDVDFMKSMERETDRELRARTAWSYGRSDSGKPDLLTLQPYLNDESPAVVRSALEGLTTCAAETLVGFENDVAKCLGHEDHVVRFLAVRVATRMTDSSFRAVGDVARTSGWPESILMAWAFVDRGYVGHPYGWHDIGTAALSRLDDPQLQLNAVLLIQHSFGGFGDSPAHSGVFDGYMPRLPLNQEPTQLADLQQAIENLYPTGNATLDWELGRLTAMLTADSPVLLEKILQNVTDKSEPVSDLHHLIIAATISSPRTPDQTAQIATALLNLHEKLEDRKLVIDRNWEPRVKEMYEALTARDPDLPKTVANHKKFGRPEHNLFVDAMQEEAREQAIALFLERVQSGEIDLTVDLLNRLGEQNSEEVLELARESLPNDLLHGTALNILAERNLPEDRDVILNGLNSEELDIAARCLEAASDWSDSSPQELAALVRLLDRLSSLEGVDAFWNETMNLLDPLAVKLLEEREQEIDMPRPSQTSQSTEASHRELAKLWREWMETEFPETTVTVDNRTGNDAWAEMRERLYSIDWTTGRRALGEELYTKKQCNQCHNGRNAVGPNLAGVTNRFSQQDLMEAIVNPHKDVSSRYRSTLITTVEGKTYNGIIIYESIDGLLLRDTSHRTIRIEADDIEFRKQLDKSLMPENLLKDCTDQQLADLYAYIKDLGK